MKTIIVFSPHNDDLEIGMGGTALKLIDEGYRIVKLVFSAGQMSNPHLKEEVIVKRRERDALQVARTYNISETIFYRLNDQKLKKELPTITREVINLLKAENPERVYLPTEKDTHPDHKAVYNFGMAVLEGIETEIYTYEVWNLTEEERPAVYVDITNYYKKKTEMINMFTTEKISIWLHKVPLFLRAKKHGNKIKVKYAERFYKIK